MRRNAGPMTAQPVSMTERAAPMDAPQPSIDPLLALTAKGMDEVNA
jgi:octaprenyl-diphosphate synthase